MLASSRRRVAAIVIATAATASLLATPAAAAGLPPLAGVTSQVAAVDVLSNATIARMILPRRIVATRSGWSHTLSGIAGQVCGHASMYPRIAQDNNISNPNRIQLGQSIWVRHCTNATVTYVQRVTSRPATTTRSAPSPSGTGSSRVERVIAYAMAQRGEWYLWGAAGPSRWDCSGLVMRSYQQVGIRLPHQSDAMKSYGQRIYSRSGLRRGDIVWPINGHVAIYLGGGMMIAAPHSGAMVRVQSLYGFYTARRML